MRQRGRILFEVLFIRNKALPVSNEQLAPVFLLILSMLGRGDLAPGGDNGFTSGTWEPGARRCFVLPVCDHHSTVTALPASFPLCDIGMMRVW